MAEIASDHLTRTLGTPRANPGPPHQLIDSLRGQLNGKMLLNAFPAIHRESLPQLLRRVNLNNGVGKALRGIGDHGGFPMNQEHSLGSNCGDQQ